MVESSGVVAGANESQIGGPGFMVMKQDASGVTIIDPSAVAGTKEEASVTTGTDTATDLAKAQARIAELEKQLEEAKVAKNDEGAGSAGTGAEAPATTTTEPATDLEKALIAIPADAQEIIKAHLAEVIVLRKAVGDMQAERLMNAALTKAREIGTVPGLTADEMAGLLVKSDEATAEMLMKQWRASAELFKAQAMPPGVPGSGASPVGNATVAFGSLTEVAKEMQTADPSITFEQAVMKAATARPDLVEAYYTAQKGA